jgi:hypothetical protein
MFFFTLLSFFWPSWLSFIPFVRYKSHLINLSAAENGFRLSCGGVPLKLKKKNGQASSLRGRII